MVAHSLGSATKPKQSEFVWNKCFFSKFKQSALNLIVYLSHGKHLPKKKFCHFGTFAWVTTSMHRFFVFKIAGDKPHAPLENSVFLSVTAVSATTNHISSVNRIPIDFYWLFFSRRVMLNQQCTAWMLSFGMLEIIFKFLCDSTPLTVISRFHFCHPPPQLYHEFKRSKIRDHCRKQSTWRHTTIVYWCTTTTGLSLWNF